MNLRSTKRHVGRLAGDLQGLARSMEGPDFLRYVGALAGSAGGIARARNLRPADERMAGRSYAFRVAGTTVTVPGADFSGAREMYARRAYFAEPRCRLPRAGHAFDLGANCGLFTVLAAKAGLTVTAVEAQAGFLSEIRRRLALNGVAADRVQLVCGLVGAATGELRASVPWGSGSHAGPTRPASYSMEQLLAEARAPRIAFLKMDVEGSEFALFDAEPGFLDRVDRLAMEVHPAFGDPQAILRVLRARGFQTAVRDGDLRPRDATSALPIEGAYVYGWRER